jgi:hypothetical protein
MVKKPQFEEFGGWYAKGVPMVKTPIQRANEPKFTLPFRKKCA